MKVRLAQLSVQRGLHANLIRMLAVLDEAQPDEWVVFPEGMLSGYFPEDPGYLPGLDRSALAAGIETIEQAVRRRGCHCLFGSALPDADRWRNSVVLVSHTGARHLHHKIELSALDRRVFIPGEGVSACAVGDLTLGLQACRELLFPQTWACFKAAGAQIIFHLNNAIQPHDVLWEHILITRAIEQSIFVCSVNNAAAPQALASYLIAPTGQVLSQTATQQDQTLTATIDLGQVIADLSQRDDY